MRPMTWILLPLLLAGCAASDSVERVGADSGARFSAERDGGELTIACRPPEGVVSAGWVAECNEMASRYLRRLAAEGRIDSVPEPAFGQAGEAVGALWDRLTAAGAEIDVSALTIRRELDLEPAD